jgi:DNA mismatch repair protein MutL
MSGMSTKIRVLSDLTINQIAAGEVIENPASVVKELVENAIDAEASRIVIEIKAGGLQLIRISDNGCGMSADDAVLAFERHATSKIRKFEDLLSVATMGFRGEALASIGAISKIALQTSPDGTNGTCVEMEGGRLLSARPFFRAKGTTVEVKQLFYNVPARKKFQKSIAQNSTEIEKIVAGFALCYPKVEFQLISQEVELSRFQTMPQLSFEENLSHRIARLFGEEFAASMHRVDFEGENYEIRGMIGSANQHRHNRSGQYLFINARSLHSPLISYAVRDGYGTRLPTQRHPVYILHVKMPERLLDINVHPQKKEVRFKEEQTIRHKIMVAISTAFEKKQVRFETPISFPKFEEGTILFHSEATLNEEPQQDMSLDLIYTPKIEPIGIFNDFFFVKSESFGEELVLVDLQAARRKILFESWTKKEGKAPERQQLLIPEVIECDFAGAKKINEKLEEITAVGIDIRPFGPQSFIVDAVPHLIDVGDIREFIDALMSDEEDKVQKLSLAASRYISRNKHAFVLQEAIKIVEEVMRLGSPYQTPEGTPIMVHINEEEIGKLFTASRAF